VDVVTFRLEERVSPCTKGGVLRYDVYGQAYGNLATFLSTS
jgi:hypothetical protein